ncbi:hypothetical protein GGS24DRAFT_498723 [Hypoxylon argillaceum]|nr:hypothetical protein GGS24DRAFT_498723 [Hypoxylon argillaceum]
MATREREMAAPPENTQLLTDKLESGLPVAPLGIASNLGVAHPNAGAPAQTHTRAHKLASAQSREAATEVMGQAIVAKLAAIFMIPADDIDLRQSSTQYGVASLVAIELRSHASSTA